MKKEMTFQECQEKGERFFLAGNFLLAKKAFAQALRLEASEALQEKVGLCCKEIALQKRKETIKKGRRLEKKSKYSQAITCFNQALAVEHETWLEKKISALKEKMGLEASSRQVEAAEASHDPTMALAAYDQALRFGATPELISKQAIALVRAERFKDAIEVFTGHPPENDGQRYYLGYALVQTGKFIMALEQWNNIETCTEDCKYDAFRKHCKALLPFALRALNAGADSRAYGIVYKYMQKRSRDPSPQQIESISSLKYRYIATLWEEERYAEVAPLLLPLPESITLPLLGFYARVYFKLAETDPDYLEMAITFWLTAIHNDKLLQSLYNAEIKQGGLGGTHEGVKIEAVRALLLQDLRELIDRYDKEQRLPDSLKNYWHLEMRLIKQIAEKIEPASLPTDRKGLELFPVTPVFADLFGLAETISAHLNEQKSKSKEENESFVEISAYYSSACRSLVLMEKGEEKAALALLSRNTRDALSTYCRQKTSFRLGVRKILEGKKETRHWFQEALPLLLKYARYREELCGLAFGDLDPSVYAELSETMEALAKRITDSKFREAAAYVMSIHALEPGVGITTAKKLLKKALALSPDSDIVKTGLQQMQTAAAFDEINKAFKKQRLSKAVKVVNQSEDPEITNYFFEAIEIWYHAAQNWDSESRLASLRDFCAACKQVDIEHPLIIEIDNDIKELERQ